MIALVALHLVPASLADEPVSPLCAALLAHPIDAAGAARALTAGADPNATCTVTHTWYAYNAPSVGQVLLGVLVPPVGIAMALSAKRHPVEETDHLPPLSLALAGRDAATVDRLLTAGADPRARASTGHSALYAAVAADLDGKGTTFSTRLIAAGATMADDDSPPSAEWLDRVFDRPDLFRVVLGHGIAVDTENAEGETLLTAAVQQRDEARVERVLVFRPAIDRPNRYRMTALQKAVDQDDVDMARLLLKYGARIEVPHDGRTPLAMAIAADHAPMAAMLLEHGADLRVKNAAGQTLLHDAADAGSPEMVTFLLDHGLEIEAVDTDGRTPLELAFDERRWAVVDLLLRRGARPDRPGAHDSPLVVAVRLRDREAFDRLVPYATTGLRDALSMALVQDDFAIADVLVARGAPIQPIDLATALLVADQRQIDWLLAHGARFGPDGLRLLGDDCTPEAIAFALEHGASPDPISAEQVAGGEPTPLLLALQRDQLDKAAVLLAHGADPELGDPLREAVEDGLVDAVTLLVEHGATVRRAHLEAAIFRREPDLLRLLAAHEHALPASTYAWGLSFRAAFATENARAMVHVLHEAARARRHPGALMPPGPSTETTPPTR